VIGRTLALYFAASFAKMVMAMFVMYFLLIAMVKYFELVWEILRKDETDVWLRTAVAMLEVPAISEHAFPFAVLFGSILSHFLARYVSLNTFCRLQLVCTGVNETFPWPARVGPRITL